MQYIRPVHPKNFDFERGKFNDLVFKKSSDSGMSVFERACAEATSGSICRHIEVYYSVLSGVPPVFYIIEEEELPTGYDIKPTVSDTGDKCHREVDGVSGKSIKKAFDNKRALHLFHICDVAAFRSLTNEDVDKWR